MTVRDAKAQDWPRVKLLLEEGFSRTHYARDGLGMVDEKEARSLFLTSVMRHGQKHGGACHVQVAEEGEAIVGLLLATTVRCYVIGNVLMATDLLWYCSDSVNPFDPFRMLKNMQAWAWSCPAVVECKVGLTDLVQNHEMAGKLLERAGFQPYGKIFRLERPATQEKAA